MTMAAGATGGQAEAAVAGADRDPVESCGTRWGETSEIPSREIGQFDLLALVGVARHAPGGPRPTRTGAMPVPGRPNATREHQAEEPASQCVHTPPASGSARSVMEQVRENTRRPAVRGGQCHSQRSSAERADQVDLSRRRVGYPGPSALVLAG